jgi:hypothetical protein
VDRSLKPGTDDLVEHLERLCQLHSPYNAERSVKAAGCTFTSTPASGSA